MQANPDEERALADSLKSKDQLAREAETRWLNWSIVVIVFVYDHYICSLREYIYCDYIFFRFAQPIQQLSATRARGGPDRFSSTEFCVPIRQFFFFFFFSHWCPETCILDPIHFGGILDSPFWGVYCVGCDGEGRPIICIVASHIPAASADLVSFPLFSVPWRKKFFFFFLNFFLFYFFKNNIRLNFFLSFFFFRTEYCCIWSR